MVSEDNSCQDTEIRPVRQARWPSVKRIVIDESQGWLFGDLLEVIGYDHVGPRPICFVIDRDGLTPIYREPRRPGDLVPWYVV